MRTIRSGIILVTAALLLSACATGPGKTGWYDSWHKCALAGGAAGLAAGAAIEDDAALASAAGGAIIGGMLCAMSDTDGDGVKNYQDDCPGTPAGGIVDNRGCEIDTDGDGVVDRLDECPGTTQGAAVDARGCEPDGDADGVADRLDECPGTPAGAAVNQHGCELDADGDGVVDRLDECADTPHGAPVDNAGCVLASAYAMEGVNFETNSATLSAESNATLDAAVEILKRYPSLQVEVAGHTDNQGDADYNQGLSQRRAQAVADYLGSHGANAANITARGYGESEPIADNGTKEGRAANRRVELRH